MKIINARFRWKGKGLFARLTSTVKNNRDGVALILVIWVLVMLVAIVGEFVYSMRTEVNITRNFKEEEEAYQLALAGIEQAKIEILSAEESSYMYLNEEGKLVFEEGNENPTREGRLGNGTFSYDIIDEERKININSASRPQLKYIVENSGVDLTDADTIIDSIIDWRDENDLHMLNGAEEDYYRSLDPPYSCKDGLFDIIQELLLVKGVTSDIFNGTAENGQEEKEGFEGIEKYFTTWGTKININTAPREVLEAVLGITASENIISQREIAPFTTPVSGGDMKSSVFTIISTGHTSEDAIKRTVKVTLQKEDDKLEVFYWNDNFI